MALKDIMAGTMVMPLSLQRSLNIVDASQKIGISKERFALIEPDLRKYIAFWREQPDMFIDFLQTGRDGEIPQGGLRFYFYQRIFLRAALRQKYTYFVFPRAQGKSFLTVLSLMIKCILQPGAKLFVTSGGKEQAASIVQEKVRELCTLVPSLAREINWKPGKTREGKDYVIYMFKNGSYFDNVAAAEKSRGKRRHGGAMEESVLIDGNILSSVIIPMMNVSRPAMDGHKYDSEPLNKSQIWVTTAGQKNTFPYRKLIQYLLWSITEPDKAFIMGGTWRIPVLVGLQDKSFLNDQKRDETFDEATFNREYRILYSLNFVNCWKTAKINKLQHKIENISKCDS